MKRIINLALLLLWLVVIFVFSNASSKESLNTSNKLIDKGISVVDTIKGSNTNEENRVGIEKEFTWVVRKIAHLIEYIILGILMINCLKDYRINSLVLVSLLLCVLCATIDELHQFFVGRTSSILDVIIDSGGSIIGLMIYCKLKNINFFVKKNVKI